jgi:hypothetical protein
MLSHQVSSFSNMPCALDLGPARPCPAAAMNLERQSAPIGWTRFSDASR